MQREPRLTKSNFIPGLVIPKALAVAARWAFRGRSHNYALAGFGCTAVGID